MKPIILGMVLVSATVWKSESHAAPAEREVALPANRRTARSDPPAAGPAGWVTGRPRLFYARERIDLLRERTAKDPAAREAWLKFRQRADQLLKARFVSLEVAEGGQGQHGNYGPPSQQAVDLAGVLGLAYRMTGERAYAEKLKAALLHYGQLKRWAGDAGYDPPWHSELNTARFCYAYAVGFDSIHDFLSAGDRQAIARAMVNLGIEPALGDWLLPQSRIHALDSMGHNWWSVCVAMAGLAALSLLGDNPQAADWVEQVSASFPEWFEYGGNVLQHKSPNFDRYGAFYESVAYADYALSEYLLFRLGYLHAFPKAAPPDIPLLGGAGDFFIQACYPTSNGMLSVNFGDSSPTATGARTVRLLLANGFPSEAYHWYLNRTGTGFNDPVSLLYEQANPDIVSLEGMPTMMAYPDIGWAMMRSSWEDDATLLAVKSGFTWNHAHADAGSFMLFHGGKPLLIDSGNCSYSRPEYSSYYRQSQAHNVILFNGQGQNREDVGYGDRGVSIPGRIPEGLDASGVRYVLADATGPTSRNFSRHYRHFLWLDAVILVIDDVRSYEPGQFEWLLHYEGEARKEEDRLFLANGERSRAMVHWLFPEQMTVAERQGLKDHQPEVKTAYLALSPKGPLQEAKFITAIVPLAADPQREPPLLERRSGPDMIGVRIRAGDQVTDLYLNLRADGSKMHRNSCHVMDGWETDAYLLAVTRPAQAARGDLDAVRRYFVVCGSYLRRSGEVVLDSLSKVSTTFEPGNADLAIAFTGQPFVRLAVRTPVAPQTLTLNGKATGGRYAKAEKLLRVSVRP